MRTTLQIDDDILLSAKVIAQAERRTVGAVISDLARRSLRPAGMRLEQGLPVFDVAPDAPAISPDDVARALDEA
jgi:hypothetical protein